MAPPNVNETRAAGAAVMAMSGDDIDRRQRQEIGDPLTAFFTILAQKMFPGEPESATVTRVRLMMASWFLRGQLEHTPIAPPDEAKAKAAVAAVAGLGGAALSERIDAEVGDVVMSYFSTFADRFMPENDPAALPNKVHLMLLAYLLRGDLAGSGAHKK
jgi:hypothetical protein